MSLPTHARAAVQVADHKIEIQEFPIPRDLRPDQALLRVEANGICGTDVEQYHGQLHASGWACYPQIPGHEAFGRIAWIGEEAEKLWEVSVGDRVSVKGTVPCWLCSECRAGRPRFCKQERFVYGFVPTSLGCGLWGGMAEYMVLRGGSVLHRVPEALSTAVAAFNNPLAAGFEWAIRVGGVGVGHTVVIFGPGQRGLGAVVAAHQAGARRIIVTGLASDAHKLELCRKFGATETLIADQEDVVKGIADITDGKLADVVLDLTPIVTQPIVDAVSCVAPYGTIVLAGIKGMRAVEGLISDQIVLKGLTIRGALPPSSWASEQSFARLVSHASLFAEIPTKLVSLDDVERGIQLLAGEFPGEGRAMHVAVTPNGSM